MPKHQWSSPGTVKELILDLLQYPMDAPLRVELTGTCDDEMEKMMYYPVSGTWIHDAEDNVVIEGQRRIGENPEAMCEGETVICLRCIVEDGGGVRFTDFEPKEEARQN
ncbi:MAG: hypothetical protein ACYSWP_12820, partial [Planctomycetota bacterium]